MTIDYGYSAEQYYHKNRSRGTLLCYHRHQVNDQPYRLHRRQLQHAVFYQHPRLALRDLFKAAAPYAQVAGPAEN
jgi:hypothetical protein